MQPNEQQTVEVLEKYLQNTSKQFTLNDASSVTGMPVLETEYGIKALMEKYDCKLKVTEGGDLIYDFGKQLHRRYAKRLGEYFRDFGRWLWKAFVISYKAVMSLLLVVYFVVFIVIIIAVMLAALAGDKDGKGAGDAVGTLIYALVRGFISIFQWTTIFSGSTYVTQDERGYDYRHYHEKPTAVEQAKKRSLSKLQQQQVFNKPTEGNKKAFAASTYDFVFGPPRVELPVLANRQEVASFLRQQKGLVSIAELQALAGWSRDEAENFMTECLANFDGRAEISINNTLYGDFSELIRSKDRTGEMPVVYYWDEYEPDYELTGNTTGRNVALIFMNIFNIVMSLLAMGALESEFELSYSSFGMIVLGWIPLIYSLLFFIIPAIRAIFLPAQRRRQRMVNIRKRLYRAIFQEHTARISLDKLTQIANEKRKNEEALDTKTVEKIMYDCIHDLGGDSFLNEKGEIIYKFDELDAELSDIETLRNEKGNNDQIGNIIMEA